MGDDCWWAAAAHGREKRPNRLPVRAFAAHATAYSASIVDLRLKPFDFNQALAKAGLNALGQPLARAGSTTAAEGTGFRSAMADALKSVSASQNEAQRLQREVALDNPTVSLEETMVAMQKAQIGFQATLQVRNRLVSAYTEIMNMQV
jgi:flagellar hook-basal body complex protein FliE